MGTGHIIDAQSEAACRPPCTNFLRPEDYTRLGIDAAFGEDGWPLLEPGEPYPDEDEDGMDDRWELATGLDGTADDSGGHALHRGYTNLEVFLDVLTGRDRQWVKRLSEDDRTVSRNPVTTDPGCRESDICDTSR